MTLSFAIIGSIAATTLKFVNNEERKNDGILSLNVKKLLILHLVWKTNRKKTNITVWEFIFHYAINSCAYLESQLT